MDDHNAPADVLELAASVGGEPIAWHYSENRVTIVMRDGRKLTFEIPVRNEKAAPKKRKS